MSRVDMDMSEEFLEALERENSEPLIFNFMRQNPLFIYTEPRNDHRYDSSVQEEPQTSEGATCREDMDMSEKFLEALERENGKPLIFNFMRQNPLFIYTEPRNDHRNDSSVQEEPQTSEGATSAVTETLLKDDITSALESFFEKEKVEEQQIIIARMDLLKRRFAFCLSLLERNHSKGVKKKSNSSKSRTGQAKTEQEKDETQQGTWDHIRILQRHCLSSMSEYEAELNNLKKLLGNSSSSKLLRRRSLNFAGLTETNENDVSVHKERDTTEGDNSPQQKIADQTETHLTDDSDDSDVSDSSDTSEESSVNLKAEKSDSSLDSLLQQLLEKEREGELDGDEVLDRQYNCILSKYDGALDSLTRVNEKSSWLVLTETILNFAGLTETNENDVSVHKERDTTEGDNSPQQKIADQTETHLTDDSDDSDVSDSSDTSEESSVNLKAEKSDSSLDSLLQQLLEKEREGELDRYEVLDRQCNCILSKYDRALDSLTRVNEKSSWLVLTETILRSVGLEETDEKDLPVHKEQETTEGDDLLLHLPSDEATSSSTILPEKELSFVRSECVDRPESKGESFATEIKALRDEVNQLKHENSVAAKSYSLRVAQLEEKLSWYEKGARPKTVRIRLDHTATSEGNHDSGQRKKPFIEENIDSRKLKTPMISNIKDFCQQKESIVENNPSGRQKYPVLEEAPDSGRRKNPVLEEAPDSGRRKNPGLEEAPDSGRRKNPGLEEAPDSGRRKNPVIEEGPDSGRRKNPVIEEGPDSGRQKNPGLEEAPDSERRKNPVVEEGPDSERRKNPVIEEGPDSGRRKNPVVEEGPGSGQQENPVIEVLTQMDIVAMTTGLGLCDHIEPAPTTFWWCM